MNMRIYKIKVDYVKFLYNYDNRVLYAPDKPDSYTENRPYVGIVLNINGLNYFAPFERYKPRHEGLTEKLVIKFPDKNGLISFNNMIPVPNNVLISFDINKEPKRDQLIAQYVFCKKNWERIQRKAEQVYKNRTVHQSKPDEYIRKFCCDFTKIEEGYRDYCRLHSLDNNQSISNSKRTISNLISKIQKSKDWDMEI
ncbi:MAG TPA: type III toxin-antitoxin system ToxN/AbiQ family toxin [Clostridia bacterium]|nr:type III toxin-antitoxin system ToxN/AbiQ family toxin [Clostridia bacterium]